MMETARDLWQEFERRHGSEVPIRSEEELRDEFHARGYLNYRADGPRFLDEIFEEGWAFGENAKRDELEQLWDDLDEPALPILDERGINVAGALVKPLPAGGWLYVDDVDGYDTLTSADGRRLLGWEG